MNADSTPESGAGREAAGTARGGAAAEPSPEEVSKYIAEMSTELHRLARGSGLTLVASLLNLVRVEAEIIAKRRRKDGLSSS
jgi:hypothetical protein